MDQIVFTLGTQPVTLAQTLAGAGALAFLLLVAVLRAVSRSARQNALEADEQARRADELEERLADLARTQAETIGRVQSMTEVLAQRQGDLARAVAERLDASSHRMGESLARASEATHENLVRLNERLALVDQARASLGELSGQVMSLRETLANKQARGAFGEGRLQAIIADALPRDSFAFQHTLSNGRRADCAIFLPGDTRPLLVDSKFPLESITAFREAPTPEARKPAEARLKADVGRHVKDIAERYLVGGETQDVALMFVPSESVYGELHEHFDDLIQQAFRARVILVSPSLLMLAVQVVQAICKDARMREQADLIRTECGKLVADVIRLRDRVGNLQKHFGQMTDDVAQALTSADKIARRGARIEQLEFEADGPARTSAPPDLFAADTLPTPPLRGAAE
ncbi:DNA recombination protein RmuC [Ancylobacter polymorphus]|jgi:DNA recombination protein RmuC|uniref:DNA recombination protein RmuC homolog n=1 Tax=Ancylobacter polymorphus TaxID=223390 RepID=A0ABU0BAN8_9HYPH|nr:DNA recombination protein RmuC [Ancylobacter polymorphus]MDQ0302381.1 DNA recombination protein RmuC [Ancylobacter polymorphus]